METKVFAVIGRGYGDEGKGLATDYLAGLFKHEKCIVVRHNGGAQSGHTVEKKSGERFVFHELSSGSPGGASTFWARTFYPDLFKLEEEITSFNDQFGFAPFIYADSKANITILFDVMINMAIETKRGLSRHGSCGMGINEADIRSKESFGITVGDVSSLDTDMLVKKIKTIREEYVLQRISKLGLSKDEIPAELFDDEITEGFAEKIKDNLKYIKVISDAATFINSFDSVIFESGQGLLLDADNEENAPFVTASKTGLFNPLMLTGEWGLKLSEAVYVTRSYVTRHGAGPLKNECGRKLLGIEDPDMTNIENEWQGSFRYAMFDEIDDMLSPAVNDMNNLPGCKASLLVTHLNETDGKIMTVEGRVSIHDAMEEIKKSGFSDVLVSESRYASDIEKISFKDV